MRASLDGLSFGGPTVLEIKCPMNVRDQAPLNGEACLRSTTRNCSTSSRFRGRRNLHYWTFDGSAGSLIRVGPDPEYLKRLLDAEAAFWQLVRDNVWPEPAGVNLETYRKTPVPVVRINFLEPGGLR